MKQISKLDVVFLDPGMYASEGFTSGLLIVVRNMIHMFQQRNLNVGVLSIVDTQSSKFWSGSAPGLIHRIDAGIDVFEYLIPVQSRDDLGVHEKALKQLLGIMRPGAVLMNTPAVFLSDKDILYRKQANETGGTVIHTLCDHLFPTVAKHGKDLVDRLYAEISKGEVLAVSKKIQAEFLRETGIKAIFFQNPINIKNVDCSTVDRDPRYIGLVNTHPLKGIEIFNRVAAMMPHHEFMVVETWPDVPDYKPTSPNITVRSFFEDPKDFYRNLKVLMVPSLYEEGSAMVTIEGLYNGLPVIANKVGSIPEMGEGTIQFIDPPNIIDTKMEGTILYPVCEEDSLQRACNDYVSAIEHALSHPTREIEAARRRAAESYIKKGNHDMNVMVDNWALKLG